MGPWSRVTSQLEANLDRFLKNWGPITWRDEVSAMKDESDPRLGRLFWALAGVEDDSRHMRVKLHWSGADRSTVIQDFNVVWLAEEAEHSRAFMAMASRLGFNVDLPSHATLHRDRRAVIAAGALRAGSVYKAGMLAAYLCLGTLQEHVALSAYNAIARDPRTPQVIEPVLKRIAAQEGRHMRFYRQGAIAVFESFPETKAFVRAVSRRTWRPPGVDLLGKRAWADVFLPVLDSETGAMIRNVDHIASELLGEPMRLMERFERGLRGNAARVVLPRQSNAPLEASESRQSPRSQMVQPRTAGLASPPRP